MDLKILKIHPAIWSTTGGNLPLVKWRATREVSEKKLAILRGNDERRFALALKLLIPNYHLRERRSTVTQIREKEMFTGAPVYSSKFNGSSRRLCQVQSANSVNSGQDLLVYITVHTVATHSLRLVL